MTPGSFDAGRLDEGGRRVDGRDRIGTEARDELLGQDAWTAADVQRSLTGHDPGEVRERGREATRVSAHEGLVGIGADRKRHR